MADALPVYSAPSNNPVVPVPDAPAAVDLHVVPGVQQDVTPSAQADHWDEMLASSQRQTALLEEIKSQIERQTTAMSQLESALEKIKMPGMDEDKRTDDDTMTGPVITMIDIIPIDSSEQQ